MSNKIIQETMFDKIQRETEERMSHYTDSRFPTDDEVTMCWLVLEVEALYNKLDTIKSCLTNQVEESPGDTIEKVKVIMNTDSHILIRDKRVIDKIIKEG